MIILEIIGVAVVVTVIVVGVNTIIKWYKTKGNITK